VAWPLGASCDTNAVARQKKVRVPASFGPAVTVRDPILALRIELRVGAIDLRATHPMLSGNAQQALAFDDGMRFELRSPLMRLLSVLLLEPAEGVLPRGLRGAQIVLPWHRGAVPDTFAGTHHAPSHPSPNARGDVSSMRTNTAIQFQGHRSAETPW
jgi:hypothetical protein